MLNVLSLFSGIGAFEKGLTNLNIEHNIVNYCEIDSHASKCYSAIHNVSEDYNLWDVTKVDTSLIRDKIDLLTHGSPCQSFSVAGKQEGGEEGSGTKSSLLWESVRIIRDLKPTYVIWENVKNVVQGKHKKVFEEYLDIMESFGYTNNYKVLNAKDYGVPQARERIFVVSTLTNKTFKFPTPIPLKFKLEDVLNFREKDDLTLNFLRRYNEVNSTNIDINEFINYINSLHITRGIGGMNMGLYNFGEMDFITTPSGITGTLTCRNVQNYNKKYWYNNKLYKPSPEMVWRLMGFDIEDFKKVESFSIDRDLYNRGGNSIVVDVVQAIFKNLLF